MADNPEREVLNVPDVASEPSPSIPKPKEDFVVTRSLYGSPRNGFWLVIDGKQQRLLPASKFNPDSNRRIRVSKSEFQQSAKPPWAK